MKMLNLENLKEIFFKCFAKFEKFRLLFFKSTNSYLLSFALVNLLTPKLEFFSLGILALFIVIYLFQDISSFIVALLVSAAIIMITIPSRFVINYFQNESQFRVLVSLFLITLTFGLLTKIRGGLFAPEKSIFSDISTFIILFLSLPIALYWRLGDETSAVRLLARTGEDNAAWLQGIASAYTGEDFPQYMQEGYYGGGPSLSVFHSIVTSGFHLNFDVTSTYGYAASILQREYGLILFLSILINLLILQKLIISKNVLAWTTIGLTIALVTYSAMATISTNGHLSTILSVILLQAIILFLLNLRKSHHSKYLTVIVVISLSALLISSSMSWYPILPIGILGLLSTLGFLLYQEFKNILQSKLDISNSNLKQFIIYIVIAVAVAVALWVKFQPLVASFLSDLAVNLNLSGGTWSATWPFLVIVILSNGLLLNNYLKDFSYLTKLVTINFFIFLAYTVFIVVASQTLTDSKQIAYAGLKLSLVFVTIYLPLAIILILRKFQDFTNIKNSILFLSLTILFLSFEGSIGRQINYPTRLGGMPIWGPGLVEGIQHLGIKSIVCLNTDTPDNNYEAYLCSRFAAGLTGKTDTDHSLWMAAILGSVSDEGMRQISSKFYEETFVLTFDDVNDFNGSPDQIGWLEETPWPDMNKLSVTGRVTLR